MQGLLSQTDALSASGQGHWARHCSFSGQYSGSYGPHPQNRSILGEGEEDRERQLDLLSDNQDKDLFVDSLVEVKECYEFGSSDKIVNVKGKLRENVSFYQSIGAPKRL